MGMISISIRGSFDDRIEQREFSAMKSGHADCVAQVIEYLSGTVLPKAIALDHKLHADGGMPELGFAVRHEFIDGDEEDSKFPAGDTLLGQAYDALIWCSGASDFQDGGTAREGWLKVRPLLERLREAAE